MYCRRCGFRNEDNAQRCVQCGQGLEQINAPGLLPQSIPNYLVHAILVTLFCCVPLGIPAIVYAAQVNGKVFSGDIEGAMDASRKARMWVWISFAAGFGWVLLWALFYGAVMLLAIVAEN